MATLPAETGPERVPKPAIAVVGAGLVGRLREGVMLKGMSPVQTPTAMRIGRA